MKLQKVLQNYNLSELKNFASRLDIRPRKSKSEMISDISKTLSEYEEYKKEKLDRYVKISQLGESGKEGTTQLVIDKKNNREYAMKCFRKAKSSRTLKREYSFLRKAGKSGVSPRAVDYDTVSKYIVMEKMDTHLYHEILKTKKLSKKHQVRILKIFSTLDQLKIFHNDANLMNYMIKDGVVYLIDYGFAREITPKVEKELGTKNPNSTLMTVGLIKKLKELGVEASSYSILLESLPEKYRKEYGLD